MLLTNDVAKYNKDIVNMRRENNSQILALQTQLQQKDEEVIISLTFSGILSFFLLNNIRTLYSVDRCSVGE